MKNVVRVVTTTFFYCVESGAVLFRVGVCRAEMNLSKLMW